jgi:hypothetical protein
MHNLLFKQGLSVMVFSTDQSKNKAVVCAGVPEKGDKSEIDVSVWLSKALEPLKGRCGKGKGGVATGQVSNYSTTLIFTYIILFKVMHICKKYINYIDLDL